MVIMVMIVMIVTMMSNAHTLFGWWYYHDLSGESETDERLHRVRK